MRNKHIFNLLVITVIITSFVACDVSGEQNYDFEVGETLSIEGPAAVAIPQDTTTAAPDTSDVTADTVSFYSKAFTINKDYQWTVSGSGTKHKVRRKGEYIDVIFKNTGKQNPMKNDTLTTTIKVDDGEYKGKLKVVSYRQSNEDAGI